MSNPLVRSSTDKMFAGICAGMAVYFGMDVTLMRVLTVVVALVTGFMPVLIGYIVLIFIIPEGVPVHKDAPSETWKPVE